jgi:hypothetical protein
MIFQGEIGGNGRRFRGRLGACCAAGCWGAQVLWEILHIDRVVHDHHGRVAERVFKLAHISGPGVLRDLRPVCETADRLAVLRAELGDEVPFGEAVGRLFARLGAAP